MGFIPTFAVLIFLFSLLGIILTPQAKEGFEDVTNREIGETAVHTVISSYFKEKNSQGLEVYKAISYRLCKSGSAATSGIYSYGGDPPRFLDYVGIKYNDIPSQCSSSSSYDEQRLSGVETSSKRNYLYRKKIPVTGGNVTTMSVRYEVE